MLIPQFIILLATLVCIPQQDPVRQEKQRAQDERVIAPAPPFAQEQWERTVPLPHYRGLQPLRVDPIAPAFAPRLATAMLAPRPMGTPLATSFPVPHMIAPPALRAPVPQEWLPVVFPAPAGELKILVPVGQALPPQPAMPW